MNRMIRITALLSMMMLLSVSFVMPAANASAMYVTNCNSWVTLRQYPSTSAPTVIRVPLGASVDAYYYNGEFYECYYQGMHGYILSTYLSNGSSGSASSARIGYLGKLCVINCNEFVTLRQYASTSAPTITKVARGQVVDAYAYNGQFCECYYNGLHGYILSYYLG